MIAPFEWFDFISGLQQDLKRGVTMEQRLVEFRDGLAPEYRRELSAFFRQAAKAPAEDCTVLESPEMGSKLYLLLEDGQTCQQFYADILAIFDR